MSGCERWIHQSGRIVEVTALDHPPIEYNDAVDRGIVINRVDDAGPVGSNSENINIAMGARGVRYDDNLDDYNGGGDFGGGGADGDW